MTITTRTANLDVSNPQEVNGNQVFSFNLENAAGYNFVLTQPDGTELSFREIFRPDNNGVIPLNGSFSKSLFLSQSGTYHLSVSGFNPKGDGLPVTSTFQLDEPAGPTRPSPVRIDSSTMTPGTALAGTTGASANRRDCQRAGWRRCQRHLQLGSS